MALQVQYQDYEVVSGDSGPPPDYNRAFLAVAFILMLGLVGFGGYLAVRAPSSSDGGFDLIEEPASSSSAQPAPTLPTSVPTQSTAVSTPTSPSTTTSAATASTGAATSTTTPSTSTTPSTLTSTSTSNSTSNSTSEPAISTPGAFPRPDVVWPDPGEITGFDSPLEAARSFAVDLVGFRAPVIGPFSDELDGMVEVRPNPNGPLTIVQVRQDTSDGSWWVVGANAADIQLDSPSDRATINGELRLVGKAQAPEGQVAVDLYIDGSSDARVAGFVTGRGDGVLGQFDKIFTIPAGAIGHGVLILSAQSLEDGSAVAVTAISLSIV